MKPKLVLLLLLMVVVVWGGWPGEAAAKRTMAVQVDKGEAVATYLEGRAQVLPQGKQTWREVKVNNRFQAGDEIAVGTKSRLEITLPDSSRLRFAEDTRFKIVQTGPKTAPDVKVHLAIGRTWANVSKAAGLKRKFEIACDNAVTGVRGTVYRMNVNEDASALVRVYDGEIAVTGATKAMETPKTVGPPTKIAGPKKIAGPRKVTMEEWTVIIRSMQQISIRKDGSADQPREFTEQEDRDAWVDWNKARDGAL